MLTDTNLVAVRRRLGYLPQDLPRCRRPLRSTTSTWWPSCASWAPGTRGRRAVVHRVGRQEVQLTDLTGERCGRLSGGQRRRVALAAALVGDAELLVLDEPDAHLDHEQRQRLTDSLRGRAGGATIVVATHDEQWARSVADRAIRLADGNLIAT